MTTKAKVVKKVRCQTPKTVPTFDYKPAVLAAEAQADIAWLPTEPKVEKDLHCIKTMMSPSQVHGVMTTLKLFTLYEQVAGNEYWGGRFKRMFPRPDFLRMATKFADTEINVHSPFYQRIDELLGLNTDEFYTSFTDSPVLKARMKFLDDAISDKDDAKSIAVFSMVEGSILYSSFAYLMSYQANSWNYLANMQAGLSFSVKDENLHSEGGAYAFKVLITEKLEAGHITTKGIEKLKGEIQDAAKQIFEHESKIIKMIFSEGNDHPVTAKDLTNFVRHRINLCLAQLEINPIYKEDPNCPINEWFYDMIGGDVQHDFFVKIGSSYNRNWCKTAFNWIKGGLKGANWEDIKKVDNDV
jgi:ribonucleotide reductase beta subunit family protein with ferritin-like domain